MKVQSLVILYLFYSVAAGMDYTNYTLYRAFPRTQADVLFLSKTLPSLIKVDFWKPPGQVGMHVDMLISPLDKEIFRDKMETEYYCNYTTLIENVQSAFDNQTIKTYTRRKISSFDFKGFFRTQDIYDWFRDQANNKPREVSIQSIGTTYEGRDILAIKVILSGSERRSIVMLEGGIHAREWISPATVCYIMNEVINADKSQDPEWKKIAYTYEWYFVPLLNPDGYEYTHLHNRVWRKNRHGGFGVDLNRNFDSAFGQVGVSRDTNEETYCGSFAFSEKESQALRDLIDSVAGRLEFYLAFHSYGQYVVIPYAFNRFHKDNFDTVYHIMQQAQPNIERRYGTKYTFGTAYDTVGYLTSGVSGCWVKAKHRVPFVATFELRDSGVYGFSLPGSLIIPNCLEIQDGLKVMLQPSSQEFQKLSGEVDVGNKQPQNIHDLIVIIFNAILFFIVYFD